MTVWYIQSKKLNFKKSVQKCVYGMVPRERLLVLVQPVDLFHDTASID